METISVKLTKQQISKVIEAYETIREFLAYALSPKELYRADFLIGLHESDEDIRKRHFKEVKSFDDFVS